MIIGNTCDDRENRHDDIGCIESPSHANLDHRIFASDISKVEESEENTFLIVRESSSISNNLFDIGDESILRDEIFVIARHEAIHVSNMAIRCLEPLSDIDIVWTRIDSDSFSGFLQYLEDHLRDTTLPIRSCDMDRFEAILRISKISTGTSDFLESIVIRRLRMEEFFEDVLVGIIHDLSVTENN